MTTIAKDRGHKDGLESTPCFFRVKQRAANDSDMEWSDKGADAYTVLPERTLDPNVYLRAKHEQWNEQCMERSKLESMETLNKRMTRKKS